MTPKPLTDDERRAAAQLGHGATQQAVADELGVSVKTVRRLLTKRADFAALVEEAREPTADTTPSAATPRGVLEELLVATNRDGSPARNLRMQAAVALSKLPDEAASDGPVIERVYVTPDDPDHDQVAAILKEVPPEQSVFVVLAARDAGPDAKGAQIRFLSGPWRPSRPDEPAPKGDAHPDPDPPRGRS